MIYIVKNDYNIFVCLFLSMFMVNANCWSTFDFYNLYLKRLKCVYIIIQIIVLFLNSDCCAVLFEVVYIWQ